MGRKPKFEAGIKLEIVEDILDNKPRLFMEIS